MYLCAVYSNEMRNTDIPVPDWLFQLISPYFRIHASENRVSIGSDNDLSPIRRQAII